MRGKEAGDLGTALVRSVVLRAVWSTIVAVSGAACDSESLPQNTVSASDRTYVAEVAPDLQGPWKLDVHYSKLDEATWTQSADGSVAVVEVFAYACRFCYTFEPYLVLWEATKPAVFRLARVPVVRNSHERSLATLYYALQALGREDLHGAVYERIHRGRHSLIGSSDEETFMLLSEFAQSYGVARNQFANAYHSSAVTANVNRAEQLGIKYKVEATPTMVVNGKYTSDTRRAGGDGYLLNLVWDLAASEQRH